MLFKTLKKGFTLIELLIVIVIIGVLAVAILSAINPIEQIRKAQDAGRRSDSAELLNALERYYTTYQQYPWDRVNPAVTLPEPGAAGYEPATYDPVTLEVSDVVPWLGDFADPASSLSESLLGSAELKPEFLQRASLAWLRVWENADGLVRICYDPASIANSNDAQYSQNGEIPTPACDIPADDADDPSDGCMMCVPE